MRVLVDATAIPADRGGVGRCVEALLPEVARAGVEVVVAAQGRDAAAFAATVPGADVVPVPRITDRPRRMLWEQTLLPALAARVAADVVHSPHYTMPLAARVPVVVTLHDATFFSHPDLHSPVKARFFRAATRLAVRRAAGLVVPSRATRDAVLRFAGGDAGRFRVAPHGVDPVAFHPVDDGERARVAAALGLTGRSYVGFLGTLEPRKNVPALIRAWVTAASGRVDPPALVLAGGPGWDTAVQPAIDAVPADLQVLRTNYLPAGDLPGFLSGAQVLAYPSLGEGFGLPVLEAMACGATVLTTRELSLPEVGGEAVAYCGTDDASIAARLTELLDRPDERRALASAALERAGEFTWAAAARVHVDAFTAAVRGARPER